MECWTNTLISETANIEYDKSNISKYRECGEWKALDLDTKSNMISNIAQTFFLYAMTNEKTAK